MSNQTVTYVVGAGAGLLGLLAFGTLVLAPALSSYRRPVEKAAVVVLSLYVLGALVGVGVLLGALIIFEWPRFF